MADISKIQIQSGVYDIKDEVARTSLESKVTYFDTVADMKLSTDLVDGDFVITAGYHAVGDCGGANYIIRTITSDDTTNEMTLIALADSTLVAEFVKNKDNHINVNQMGAYGDGTNDDSVAIQNAFDISSDYDIIEFASDRSYIITQTIYVLLDRNIYGNNATIYQNEGTYLNNFMFQYNVDSNDDTISIYPKATAEIKDLIIIGNRVTHENNNFLHICQHVDIHHIRFENINKGIYFTGDYIDRCDIHHIYCNGCGNDSTYFIYLGGQGDNKYVHDCQMGNISSGSLNFVSCGNNLLNVVIDRLVGCSVDIYSPATISNMMLTYYCTIKVHNHNFTIENVRYSKNKENKYRIELLNDNESLYKPNFSLKNIIGIFVGTEIEYSTMAMPSIYIEKCGTYKFENVLTGVRSTNNYLNVWYAFEKIDSSENIDMTSYNEAPSFLNGKLIENENFVGYEKNKTPKIGISSISLNENLLFKGTNTTYYYSIQTLMEDNFTSDLSSEYSITVDNDYCPYLVLGSTAYLPYKIRVLRGTSSGTYTEYVDIVSVSGRLIDNGVSMNGIGWNTFGTAVTSVTNNDTCVKMIKYKRYSQMNQTLYCNHSPLAQPTKFTNEFTKGDVIILNNSPFSQFIYDGSEWLQQY